MNHETSEKIREIEAALLTSLIVLESSHDDLDALRAALASISMKLDELRADLEKIAPQEGGEA